MKREEFTIGVLGGMGTYATIHLFQQYAEVFPAVKEWDRPRMIIDNRCTMPSRVRALLYNENRDELVSDMAGSIRFLIQGGAQWIVLACNTSHLFLEDVYQIVPEARNKVLNIIDACVDEIKNHDVTEVSLLATEGTIISGVYNKKLEEVGIKCILPSEKDYSGLRECIEAVKQNKYDENVYKLFASFVNRRSSCILGCTELPILYEKSKHLIHAKDIYDPLWIALNRIHDKYVEEES